MLDSSVSSVYRLGGAVEPSLTETVTSKVCPFGRPLIGCASSSSFSEIAVEFAFQPLCSIALPFALNSTPPESRVTMLS